MLDWQLNGKTAIVTGGAAGIGYSIVRRLAEAGVSVMIADVAGQAQAKAERLREEGCPADCAIVDITREADAERMAEAAVRAFGGIDILINCAGIYPRGGLLETTEAMWDQVLGVNLKGMFLCCKAVVPYMQERGGGAIVNLGSSHATTGLPELFAYSVSKGGVSTLTRNLAGALAPSRIRVNCVNPGWVATEKEITEREAKGQSLEWLLEKGKSLPLGRMQTGDDTAAITLFLVSGLAAQITGQIIHVDGGKEVATLFDDRSHDVAKH